MQIAILCGISLLLSVASWVYFSYVDIEEETFSSKKIGEVIFNDKKVIAYVAVMLIALCAMSVNLSYIYINNTLIHNIKMITLLSLLFVVAFTDFKKYIIPNKILLVGIALRCTYYIVELVTKTNAFWDLLKNDLIACLIAFLFLIVGIFIVKNGLGMGDVKLILVMCLYQGMYGIVSSMFCSLIVAFFLSLGLLIMRKKTRKDAMPFAPSILIGTFISIFITGM